MWTCVRTQYMGCARKLHVKEPHNTVLWAVLHLSVALFWTSDASVRVSQEAVWLLLQRELKRDGAFSDWIGRFWLHNNHIWFNVVGSDWKNNPVKTKEEMFCTDMHLRGNNINIWIENVYSRTFSLCLPLSHTIYPSLSLQRTDHELCIFVLVLHLYLCCLHIIIIIPFFIVLFLILKVTLHAYILFGGAEVTLQHSFTIIWYMSLWWGKPEYPEETHAGTGRTCKLHTERTWSDRGSNRGPSCCEATVLTTEPPCCPWYWKLLKS